MGYEIAGGLGVKMAAPEREVYVMVGDGSYLMMNSEIVTSIQEGYKLTIVLVNNYGFSSIGGLSDSVGSGGFGTLYRYRNSDTGQLDGGKLPVDFAAHARSLGATVFEAKDLPGLTGALEQSKQQKQTTVIVVETDPEQRVPGYESWWDVPVAEVSEMPPVREAFAEYDKASEKKRHFL
jgi:3D-(3,5/4)-trihydroxycyclohexane-1,2-dione acylhydrolase (decyclizing)